VPRHAVKNKGGLVEATETSKPLTPSVASQAAKTRSGLLDLSTRVGFNIRGVNMPLVPLETALHPPELLRQPLTDESSRWWVIHTRPRSEKALARHLLARNLSYYLPIHLREWRSRGRHLCSHLPLFPGYLFLHGDHQARLQALETNLVALVLPVIDQAKLYDDLLRVEQMIAAGVALTHEERLEPGRRVAITAGPLAGMSGTVLRRGKQLKFLIEVQFLRRGISAEIESWMLEAVTEEHAVPA
jgi:transcription antitermination factor NusG